MGTTSIDQDTFFEYIEGMKQVYLAERYFFQYFVLILELKLMLTISFHRTLTRYHLLEFNCVSISACERVLIVD